MDNVTIDRVQEKVDIQTQSRIKTITPSVHDKWWVGQPGMEYRLKLSGIGEESTLVLGKK